MKFLKACVLVIAFHVLMGSVVLAQSGAPAQPAYEKKVWVKENGNIYVQKSLPLYLKFSTTPDGKNHNLVSKRTARYGNPMYLDTEGINWIRSRWAVDPDSRRTVSPQMEIMYEIYADGRAPYTSIRFTDAPRYVGGGVVYYGKGLNVTLTSRDAVSGVEGTHYALSSGSYAGYSSSFSVSNEQAYDLYYYANDMVGNAENSRHKAFTVDITAPKTIHEIVGIVYNGNIISPKTRFKLTTTDNLSGVRRTYYTYDDRSKTVYPGYKVSAAYLRDGDHTLHYEAIDNVRNEETRASFGFYLDKIPPIVEYAIEGDFHQGKYKFISNRSKISMSATDNKAGVREITYNIDATGNETYGSAYSIPDRKGLHYVKYFGTDNVENRSGRKNLTVYMDNVAPSTGIVYGRPQFFTRDTLFINSTTRISLYPRDFQSGVQKTEYAIDGGSFVNYERFTIDKEGHHSIKFKATDRVNNEEQVKESLVYVDNTPPVIYHNFSIQPIGSRDNMKLYPNYTRLYLGATDSKTGTARIMYSLNGGKTWKDYSSPYTLDISELNIFRKSKRYSVLVKAKDKLGNESEATIEFFVGKPGKNN